MATAVMSRPSIHSQIAPSVTTSEPARSGSQLSKLTKEQWEKFVSGYQTHKMQNPNRQPDDANLRSLRPDKATIQNGIASNFPSSVAEPDKDESGNWITNLTIRWERHAEGFHNRGDWVGPDAPLTEKGIQQAKDMGYAFAQSINGGERQLADIDFLSPLDRCVTTHKPIDVFTKAYQANQDSLKYKNMMVYLPLAREQITSDTGKPSASHIDELRTFDGAFWNGAGAKGTEDLWDEQLNESPEHMKKRMEEELLSFYVQTGSEFTQHTGKSNVVLATTAHADNGRELEKMLGRLAGMNEVPGAGYLNTEIKDFGLSYTTDAKTGKISFRRNKHTNHYATFKGGITPEFGKEYRALEAAHRRRQGAGGSSRTLSDMSQNDPHKISSDALAELKQSMASWTDSSLASTYNDTPSVPTVASTSKKATNMVSADTQGELSNHLKSYIEKSLPRPDTTFAADIASHGSILSLPSPSMGTLARPAVSAC